MVRTYLYRNQLYREGRSYDERVTDRDFAHLYVLGIEIHDAICSGDNLSSVIVVTDPLYCTSETAFLE